MADDDYELPSLAVTLQRAIDKIASLSYELADCKAAREEYARLNVQAAERIAQLERQLVETW